MCSIWSGLWRGTGGAAQYCVVAMNSGCLEGWHPPENPTESCFRPSGPKYGWFLVGAPFGLVWLRLRRLWPIWKLVFAQDTQDTCLAVPQKPHQASNWGFRDFKRSTCTSFVIANVFLPRRCWPQACLAYTLVFLFFLAHSRPPKAVLKLILSSNTASAKPAVAVARPNCVVLMVFHGVPTT